MPRPYDLTDLPEGDDAEDDLLSHVLGTVRLAGKQVDAVTLAPGVVLDSTQLEGACLFATTTGAAELRAGGDRFTLGGGDLVLLPEGAAGGGLTAGPDGARLLLARFRFDAHSLKGMVLTLPRIIHITRDDGAPWLDGIVHFLGVEADDDQPGAVLMVSRLIDLIVIRALRTWSHRGRTQGWLGGLADPRIARALAALHADPLRRWRLEEMADAAGMSRSSFCDRFVTLTGSPPLRYGNELRLGVARTMIADGMRVGEAGLRIGYESEAAFSRAYRALFGHSPIADRGAPISSTPHRADTAR